MNIELEKKAKRKEESRKIVQEIINYGVTEEQKYDIMFNLSLTLENNTSLKEITTVLKKFINFINTDEEISNVKNNNKIIIE